MFDLVKRRTIVKRGTIPMKFSEKVIEEVGHLKRSCHHSAIRGHWSLITPPPAFIHSYDLFSIMKLNHYLYHY